MSYLQLFKVTFFAAALLLASSQATASANKPVDPNNMSQLINLFDVVVKYPMPSWVKTADLSKETNISKNSDKKSWFLFQQIPKSESFEKWTKLFAVTGEYSKKNEL